MSEHVDELLDRPFDQIMDMHEVKSLLLGRVTFLKTLTESAKAQKIRSRQERDTFQKAFPEAHKLRQEFLESRDAELREQVYDGFRVIAVVQKMMSDQACQLILKDVSLFAELEESCTKFLSAHNDGFELIRAQDSKEAEEKIDPLADILAEFDEADAKRQW
jgi:hypothetical protein